MSQLEGNDHKRIEAVESGLSRVRHVHLDG